MLDMVWAFIKGSKNLFIPIGTAIGGLLLGLIIAWGIWPADVTDAVPSQLSPNYQIAYFSSLATVYALDNESALVQQSLDAPGGSIALCNSLTAAREQGLVNSTNALESLANTRGGCDQILSQAETAGDSNFLRNCGLGLLLLVIGGLFFFVWQRRQGGADISVDFPTSSANVVKPTAPPTMSSSSDDGDGGVAEPAGVTPIASYRTTFVRGYDAFDDSFSIENANGDFLGECGVGIAESIGTDSPRNVTALEVWLFDKNDIRTITKVAMSDFAFFDEAIKAKLAPKGEPILSRPDEVIVLETASLIINAHITELVYGESDEVAPKSYFERFGVELSAWSKDDAPAGGGNMNFDDMF